jgi:hypothetical protein
MAVRGTGRDELASGHGCSRACTLPCLSARGWLGSRYSVMVVGMVSSGVVATSYRGGGSSPGVGLWGGLLDALDDDRQALIDLATQALLAVFGRQAAQHLSGDSLVNVGGHDEAPGRVR